MDRMLRRSSHTTSLLEMLWEVVCCQRKNQRIPVDYVLYQTMKMRWLVNRLPALDKNIQRLVDLKCIKVFFDHRDGQLIRITQEGVAVLIHHCMTRKAKSNFSINREVCIVSFDIPESRRNDRLVLRRLLKVAKFKRVHKSTWVGQPQIVSHLIYFITRQRLQQHVHVYFGKEKYIH